MEWFQVETRRGLDNSGWNPKMEGMIPHKQGWYKMIELQKETMRALRRHHKFRMRKHAMSIRSTWVHDIELKKSRDDLAMEMAKLGDNFTKCSCHMCGNPRHWMRLPTRQELIHDKKFEISSGLSY